LPSFYLLAVEASMPLDQERAAPPDDPAYRALVAARTPWSA
jgi:hypothetical protein